jgi:hypothetical protein
MSLLKNSKFIFLLAAVASPTTAFALSCKEDITESTAIRESLGTALAVAADAPDGTIIWESPPHTIKVRCADDREVGSETVYFHMNPLNTTIGNGIRAGIRYLGEAITANSGKVSTRHSSHEGCDWANCTGWNKARFTLTFTVFIEKYGPTPPSGQATSMSEYRVFQLDGANGLNPVTGSNLNYIVTGINNIRFVPCSPKLTITPSTINFPRALSSTAIQGDVASTANFTLGLARSCDTPYTVNARFASTSGGGSIINNLLVPANNSSVGISLFRVETAEKIPFNTWFKLADLTGGASSTSEFRADVIWREPPKIGPFEAAVVVDLFYK